MVTALQGPRPGTPKTWSLCARACTAWPCSASRMQRAAGTSTRRWCRACWPWLCRQPCKVSAGLEGERGEQATPGLSGVPDPAVSAAADAFWHPWPSRVGSTAPCQCPRALLKSGGGSGGCACLLPLNSRLQQVPFLPLPAESTHTLPSKALLEEEVLAAMIPVISAATTHLSPE